MKTTLEKLPKDADIYIARVYPKGVEPVEPNEFEFAVVVVVPHSNPTVATIKALCKGLTRAALASGRKALKHIGVTELAWRHNLHEQTKVACEAGLACEVCPKKDECN